LLFVGWFAFLARQDVYQEVFLRLLLTRRDVVMLLGFVLLGLVAHTLSVLLALLLFATSYTTVAHALGRWEGNAHMNVAGALLEAEYKRVEDAFAAE